MNSVNLLGRLTKDPEVKDVGEMKVARFGLAVNRPYKKDKQEADFINIVAFNKNAEFCEKWLKKGQLIGLAGSIRTGKYQNKEGNTIYTFDVVGEKFYFTGSGEKKEEKTENNSNESDIMAGFTPADDGIDGLSFLNG